MFGIPTNFGAAQGAAPVGGGGMFGRIAGGMQGAQQQQPQQRPMQAPQQAPSGFQRFLGGAQHGFGGATVLSDARSKQKIQDLESVKQRYEDLLDGPSAQMPETRQPDTSALDAAYRRPTTNSYEYKDPNAPGAAPGEQVGPMAHELRGIPGVVHPGADGMDRVHTPRLTMANTSQLAQQRRELDELHQRLADLSDGGDTDGVLRAAAGGR